MTEVDHRLPPIMAQRTKAFDNKSRSDKLTDLDTALSVPHRGSAHVRCSIVEHSKCGAHEQSQNTKFTYSRNPTMARFSRLGKSSHGLVLAGKKNDLLMADHDRAIVSAFASAA